MGKQHKFPDIVACRHGQSLANFLGDDPFLADDPRKNSVMLALEDYQVPLTTAGIEQAKKLGIFLRKEFGVPDVAIDSGYVRAMQTRQSALNTGYSQKEIAKMIIKSDDRFRERECGTLRKTSLAIRDAVPYWLQHQRDWKANPYQSRPIGGESIADQVVRTRQAILEIKDMYPNKLVFIFCHGHTLRAIHIPMAELTARESNELLKNSWLKNCAVNFYRGKKCGWKNVRSYDPLT